MTFYAGRQYRHHRLGNVGSGTLHILSENANEIAAKLGFRLKVSAVCSRTVAQKRFPAGISPALVTADWREVVNHPEVDIVAELGRGHGASRKRSWSPRLARGSPW